MDQVDPISVLIPTYNRSPFIGACLESIFRQTYSHLNVIVYDDGSTDHTLDIVRTFPVDTIIEGGRNRGVSYARNRLLEACNTPYATWQDSDDVSNIYRIETQYKEIRKTGAPIVYCQYRREQGRIPEMWTQRPATNTKDPANALCGSLFDVARCRQILFDESLLLAGEDIIWRKAVEKQFGPPATVHQVLYHLRLHPNRITYVKKRPENKIKWAKNRTAYANALKSVETDLLSICLTVRKRSKLRLPDGSYRYLLPECLRSIARSVQGLGSTAVEVVISDFDSSDWPLEEWIDSVLWNIPFRIIKGDQDFHSGLGRNLAADQARGNYLLFLDTDMLLHEQVIRNGLQYLQQGKVYFPICFYFLNPEHTLGFWCDGGKGISFMSKEVYRQAGKWPCPPDYKLHYNIDQRFFRKVKATGVEIINQREADYFHQYHPGRSVEVILKRKRSLIKKHQPPTKSVTISTVTPVKIFKKADGTLSRPLHFLERHLQSLRAQKTAHSIRPVLSDMSPDPEVRVAIEQIAQRYGAQYLYTPSDLVWNKPLCLNAGIQASPADSQYLATLDLDILFRHDVFEKCVQLAQKQLDHPPVIVCRTFLYNHSDYLGDFSPKAFNQTKKHGKFLIVSGNGGIQFFERNWLVKVRGYDERFNLWGGPDNEMVNRARAAGKAVIWLSKEKKEVYLLHLKHPEWSIPGLSKAQILQNLKDCNRKIQRGPIEIVANPGSWGEASGVIGPRFAGDQIKFETAVNAHLQLSRKPDPKMNAKMTDRKPRIAVLITTCNRPHILQSIRQSLEQEAKDFQIACFIFDDSDKRNGKQGFWKSINALWSQVKGKDFDYYIHLQDDMKLCDDFVKKAVQAWERIDDPRKVGLTLLLDGLRVGRPNWTGRWAEIHHFHKERYLKTQWLDMLFICEQDFFEQLNWTINPVPLSRWRKHPSLSDGVGTQISTRLHKMGRHMYQVSESLLETIDVPSEMHPELRPKEPIQDMNLPLIVAGLASMPKRESTLRKTLESILPYVDQVFAYLNEYPKIPEWLANIKKVKAFLSREAQGDLGDAGKFYGLSQASGKNFYYFSLDDDIIYPCDYIWRMIRKIEAYNRKCIVGTAGYLMQEEVNHFYKDRKTYWHNNAPNREDRPVHLLLTHVAAWHVSTLDFHYTDCLKNNMGDLWLALAAQRQQVPMLLIERPANWVKAQQLPLEETIYGQYRDHCPEQTEIFNSWQNWQAIPVKEAQGSI